MKKGQRIISIFAMFLVIGLMIFAGCSKSLDTQTNPRNKSILINKGNFNSNNSYNAYYINLAIGPNKIFRIKGKPLLETGSLDICKGDLYKLVILNGDGEKNEITSGEIWIGGEKIVSENEFKRKRKQILKNGVFINNDASFKIKISGKPGTFITISLYTMRKREPDYRVFENHFKIISKNFAKLLEDDDIINSLNIFFVNNGFNKINLSNFLNSLDQNDDIVDLKNEIEFTKINFNFTDVYVLKNNVNFTSNIVILYKIDKINNIGYGYDIEGNNLEINLDSNNYTLLGLYPFDSGFKDKLYNAENLVNQRIISDYMANTYILCRNDIGCTDIDGNQYCSLSCYSTQSMCDYVGQFIVTKAKLIDDMETWIEGDAEIYVIAKENINGKAYYDLKDLNDVNVWTTLNSTIGFVKYFPAYFEVWEHDWCWFTDCTLYDDRVDTLEFNSYTDGETYHLNGNNSEWYIRTDERYICY